MVSTALAGSHHPWPPTTSKSASYAPHDLDVLRLAFRFVIGAPHEDASFNVYSARGGHNRSVTRVNMEVVAGAALIVTPAPLALKCRAKI